MDENSILSKYSRSPKIYLALPSKGKFYAESPTQKSGTGELPILSMTARDELIFRTPDALMNGDAVAEVIRSCVPLISNPWDVPSIDMDSILIAIRIATTGEELKMDVSVPGTDDTLEFSINLPTMLDTIKGKEWKDTFTYEDLTFTVIPLKLKDQNFFEIESFETQRFIKIMQDEGLTTEKRKELVQQVLDKASINNVDVVAKQVIKISNNDGEETNPAAIKEFLMNTDTKMFTALREFLIENRSQFDVPAQTVQVPSHLVEQGAPETLKVPVFLNNVNFFV